MFQGHVTLNRSKLTRQCELIQRSPKVLTHLTADAIRLFHQCIQRAVIHQPTRSCFWPYLRYPGDIVRGVSHEREEVDDSIRWHAEFLLHALLVIDYVLHAVAHRDAGAHQLRQVFVTTDNERLHIVV